MVTRTIVFVFPSGDNVVTYRCPRDAILIGAFSSSQADVLLSTAALAANAASVVGNLSTPTVVEGHILFTTFQGSVDFIYPVKANDTLYVSSDGGGYYCIFLQSKT
jgi:hypothetical protein